MSPRRPISDDAQSQRGGCDGGPAEAAAFIADALADLKLVSRRHSLATLTYLLDLSHMEAEDIARIQGGQTMKPKA